MSAAPSTSSSSSPAPPAGATSPRWCYGSPEEASVEDRHEALLARFGAARPEEEWESAKLRMLDRVSSVAGQFGAGRRSFEHGHEGVRTAAGGRTRAFRRQRPHRDEAERATAVLRGDSEAPRLETLPLLKLAFGARAGSTARRQRSRGRGDDGRARGGGEAGDDGAASGRWSVDMRHLALPSE